MQETDRFYESPDKQTVPKNFVGTDSRGGRLADIRDKAGSVAGKIASNVREEGKRAVVNKAKDAGRKLTKRLTGGWR